MMTMRFSKEQIHHHYPHCQTLKELFRAVEKTAEDAGRVVCQFRINGVNFTEADEKKVEGFGLGELNVVEVLLDTPDNLLTAVLLNWLDELPRMIANSDGISAALRADAFNIQHTPIVRLIDSCQFLVESLVSLKTFPAVQAVISATDWENSENGMVKAISETCDAFEKRDANWVADVMEYDLASSLQRWLEILKDLHGSLTSGGQIPTARPAVLPQGE